MAHSAPVWAAASAYSLARLKSFWAMKWRAISTRTWACVNPVSSTSRTFSSVFTHGSILPWDLYRAASA